MTRIRVVLADDHVLLREGISRLVAATDDLELAGTAGDLPGLLALAERERPDVVVTDIRMPPTGTDEGIQAAAWIREHLPGTGVVVLSQYVAPELRDRAAGRRLGRPGVPAEGADRQRRRAGRRHQDGRGGRLGHRPDGGRPAGPLAGAGPSAGVAALTPRELEILAEMAQGKSNSAIAATLFVTERAVEKHTNSIFAKLNLSEERDVNRRVKAVLVYLTAATGS